MGSLLRPTGGFNVKKVAIIGAGPSGLATAKYLLAEQSFDKIDIFEQQAEVGGVWHYIPIVGEKVSVPSADPHIPPEKPIWPKHSKFPLFMNPMYDQLNTNIPKGLMSFSDLPFPEKSLLFPTRQDVQDYLIKYSQEIRSLISFSTQVDNVHLSSRTGEAFWQLTSKSTITGVSKQTEYDAIVVANGHYSVPFIPEVPGIEAFNKAHPGVITHSKIYRSPEKFTNQKVIVVGNAASGLDIGTQISIVSQQPLLNSVRTNSQSNPENREEVPPIAEYLVDEKGVRLEDGRIEKGIDAVVYCTGYLYSYPFLETIDPPVITTGRRALGIYNHLIDAAHGTLAFPALVQKVIPFPVAEAQGAAIAKIWTNKLHIPPKEEMDTWEKERAKEYGQGTSFLILGYPNDADYIKELHDWVKSAPGAAVGKEPPLWGERERRTRELYVEIKKKFTEAGGTATTLAELGYEFLDV